MASQAKALDSRPEILSLRASVLSPSMNEQQQTKVIKNKTKTKYKVAST